LLAPFNSSSLATESTVGWLLQQNFADRQSRIERLEILSSSIVGIARTNVDFITSVDRVVIPGISASPVESVSEVITGTAAINQNSIDAILNNPNRTPPAQGASNSWADFLRRTFEVNYGGRFSEFIENEIRNLGLENPPPELRNSTGQNE
jgi:hypothetical protein